MPGADGDRRRILPGSADWRAAADVGTALRSEVPGAAVRDPATEPPPVAIPTALVRELIDWSLRGVPNEACGLVAGDRTAADGGRALRFLPLRNAAESPYRYLIDPQEQLTAMLDLDDRDEVVWAIFHSHVSSPAVPSATDVGLAFYPDSLYLLCSLAGEPHVRAWSIQRGAVTEVPLEVVAAEGREESDP